MSKESIARVLATAFAVSCCLTLAACEDEPDSPSEALDRAGDAIDDAADDASDAIDDTFDGN